MNIFRNSLENIKASFGFDENNSTLYEDPHVFAIISH